MKRLLLLFITLLAVLTLANTVAADDIYIFIYSTETTTSIIGEDGNTTYCHTINSIYLSIYFTSALTISAIDTANNITYYYITTIYKDTNSDGILDAIYLTYANNFSIVFAFSETDSTRLAAYNTKIEDTYSYVTYYWWTTYIPALRAEPIFSIILTNAEYSIRYIISVSPSTITSEYTALPIIHKYTTFYVSKKLYWGNVAQLASLSFPAQRPTSFIIMKYSETVAANTNSEPIIYLYLPYDVLTYTFYLENNNVVITTTFVNQNAVFAFTQLTTFSTNVIIANIDNYDVIITFFFNALIDTLEYTIIVEKFWSNLAVAVVENNTITSVALHTHNIFLFDQNTHYDMIHIIITYTLNNTETYTFETYFYNVTQRDTSSIYNQTNFLFASLALIVIFVFTHAFIAKNISLSLLITVFFTNILSYAHIIDVYIAHMITIVFIALAFVSFILERR